MKKKVIIFAVLTVIVIAGTAVGMMMLKPVSKKQSETIVTEAETKKAEIDKEKTTAIKGTGKTGNERKSKTKEAAETSNAENEDSGGKTAATEPASTAYSYEEVSQNSQGVIIITKSYEIYHDNNSSDQQQSQPQTDPQTETPAEPVTDHVHEWLDLADGYSSIRETHEVCDRCSADLTMGQECTCRRPDGTYMTMSTNRLVTVGEVYNGRFDEEHYIPSSRVVHVGYICKTCGEIKYE